MIPGIQIQACMIYYGSIALHLAWNFTQSGIFGAITSGNEKTRSLFEARIQGSELITGGQFGPEGSIQATLLYLLGATILLILSKRKSQIIDPSWKS